MSEQERHEMKCVAGNEGGDELWECPTCGRQVVICWWPKFSKKTVTPGNENAIHTGGKGIGGAELTIERPNVTTHISPRLDADVLEEDKNVHLDFATCEYYEAPYKKFMKDKNLEDL